MMVEEHNLTMEVDTGASVSLVSEETVNNSQFLLCLPLQQTNVTLRTYTGQPVSVPGQLFVKDQHDEAQVLETMWLKFQMQHYWGEIDYRVLTGLKNSYQTAHPTYPTGSPV